MVIQKMFYTSAVIRERVRNEMLQTAEPSAGVYRRLKTSVILARSR
jgi:hypothetical protein